MKKRVVGLAEFLQVMGDFRRLSSLAVKGCFAAPAVAAMTSLAPPPKASTAVVTLLFQFATLMLLFQSANNKDQRAMRLRMVVAGVVFIGCAFATFLLVEQFSVPVGHGHDRVVIGFSVRPEVQAVLNQSYTAYDALRGYEYDADRVWTSESVLTIHLVLTAVWMGTFVALTMYFGYFILLLRYRRQ